MNKEIIQRLRPILACSCGSVRESLPAATAPIKALKKHPQYLALNAVMWIGLGMAGLSGIHATMNPEVVWRHRHNPEPWHYYWNRQSKLWSAGRDYSVGCLAPKY